MNNIPQLKNPIPVPPRKRNVWDRYSSGEKLMPTYNKAYPKSNIPLPPKPAEPRTIHYSGIDKKIFLLGITVFVILLAILIYNTI